MADDLELKELEQFYGTESYHNVMGMNCTDGVAYIMKNGYSWFVTDAIAVIITKLRNEGFLSIKLNVKDEKADMLITDGNNKELYKQHYKWTNAKRNVELYYMDGVMMLTREY